MNPDPSNSEIDPTPPTPYARAILLSAVVIVGAAVMIYEFIAVRILQRYFGGRIDVWASEIAVCMAGLALGYYLGGHLADRYRSTRVLGAGLIAAGLAGTLIMPIAEATGERLLQVDIGLAWHPLLAATFSSFLPFLALGTIVPQAIRIQTRTLATAGTTAGNIVALSTAGSIAGVLATGMYLLNHFSVSQTLLATSGVLVLTGILVAIPRPRAAALLIPLLLANPFSAHAQILFNEYSAYHHILVEDDGDTRILWFDNNQESLMSRSNPKMGGFEYTDFFHIPMAFDPSTTRVLFMGLGGGTGPKSFLNTYPRVKIEVAEIDPMVARVARKYFAVPNDRRLRIAIADARAYMQRARGPYGIVILDAYTSTPRGGYIPYHLATQEFFQIISDKLTNGGCLVYNVITTPNFGSALNDLNATLLTVFDTVYAFRARTSQNTLLVAVKIDLAGLREDGTRDGIGWPSEPWFDHPLSVRTMQALAQQMDYDGLPLLPGLAARMSQSIRLRAGGRILIDDFAPTDTAPRR